MKKVNIKSLTLEEITDFCKQNELPKFRAEQIFRQIYFSGANSIEEMKLIDSKTKDKLIENFEFDSFKEIKKFVSVDKSVKFLFTLNDGNKIEAVFMPWLDEEGESERNTLCVSSQIGCSLDCKFCATGTMDLKRNLEVDEIVSQVLEAENQTGEKITNIVYMGMGEPLLNFKNVKKSIEILSDLNLPKVSRKKITVSTSGVIPKIYKLADLSKPVKLALSLHATTNGVRDKIVPLNQKSNISELMDAIEFYYRKTNLPITYEYIPFENLNDSEDDAKRLAKVSKRVPSRINIIPFNDISFTNPQGISAELKPTSKSEIKRFADQIKKYGGIVTIRDTFGSDIDAACGQLALSETEGK